MPPRICVFGGEAHSQPITCACLGHRSGKVFATSSSDKMLMLWSINEKYPILKFGDFRAPVTAFEFNYPEDQIAFGTQDGYLSMLDLEEAKTMMSWSSTEEEITSICIHPTNQNYIATGDVNGKIKIYSTDYQTPIQQYFAHKTKINEIKFNSLGNYLMTCADDGEIVIIDVTSGRTVFSVKEQCPVKSVDFHPFRQLVCSCCSDKSVHVYNLYDEETNSAFMIGRSPPTKIKFGKDGETFSSFSSSTISLFSTDNLNMVDHYLTSLDTVCDANLFNEGLETIHVGNKYPSLNLFNHKIFRLMKPIDESVKKAIQLSGSLSAPEISGDVKSDDNSGKPLKRKKKKSKPDEGDAKKATSIYKKFRSTRATFLATISRRQNADERICEILRNKGVLGLAKEVSNTGECAYETLQLLETYKGVSIPQLCPYIIGISRFCVRDDPLLAFKSVKAALLSGAQRSKEVQDMMRDIAPRIVEYSSADDETGQIAKEISLKWPDLIK